MMLAQGYHIFAPNFRGSTGYGAEFVKLVERDWAKAQGWTVLPGSTGCLIRELPPQSGCLW